MSDEEFHQEREIATSNNAHRSGTASRMSGLIGDDGEPGRVVPCRQCGRECHIAGAVWSFAKMASGICMQKGWGVIEANEITMCDACADVWRGKQREKSLTTFGKVTEAIRQVKERNAWPSDIVRQWMLKNSYRDTVLALDEMIERKRNEQKNTGKRGRGTV